MGRFAYLVALLFLSGCGTVVNPLLGSNPAPPQQGEIEEAIRPYYDRFLSLSQSIAGQDISHYPVSIVFQRLEFDPKKGGVNGLCRTASDQVPEIQIDPVYWDLAADSQKENLVFHEAGHCILGRGHDNTLDQQGLPRSIMFPYTLSPNLYASRRDNLLSELFTNSPLFGLNRSFSLAPSEEEGIPDPHLEDDGCVSHAIEGGIEFSASSHPNQ